MGRLTLRSMIPRGYWLCMVWYHGEIDSAQYDTPGWFIKYRITQWKLNQIRKCFNPLVSGPGWFELWKKWRSKISLDCPFNVNICWTCTHRIQDYRFFQRSPILMQNLMSIYAEFNGRRPLKMYFLSRKTNGHFLLNLK